jgi:hypothetical protein
MWRFGLRGRMATSYVLVTATAVLIVEAELVSLYLLPLAGDSNLASRLQSQAAGDAKRVNLTVNKVWSLSPGLSPSRTSRRPNWRRSRWLRPPSTPCSG